MTLSDNGSGIPEEYQPTLFEPFVTHKSGGTGLGLALSRKIAEAHGGQLLLSSSNSSGTCFTVILPTKWLPVQSQVQSRLHEQHCLLPEW